MDGDPIGKLVKIGFSEYEAKAYVALLRESPVTGYQLSKQSGVPRSMIYEVLGKLTARGAAMTLRKGGSTQYAPVPAVEFLDQLHREHEELVVSLKGDLAALTSAPDLEYVWNIEGHENIMAKAEEMIRQAKTRIYLAFLPATFPALQPGLERAIRQGVRTVLVVFCPSIGSFRPISLPDTFCNGAQKPGFWPKNVAFSHRRESQKQQFVHSGK